MHRRTHYGMAVAALLCATAAWAQPSSTAAQLAPGQKCTPLPQAHAAASAATPNVRHDGSPLPGTPPPDGLNITPLQQILFDGTTDFAERHGFIVVAPMGHSSR